MKPVCLARRARLVLSLAIAASSAVSAGWAADWPPTLDAKNATTQSQDGRKIERFVHGPRDSWGYPAESAGEWEYPPAQESGVKEQNHSSFYVVAPKNPRENAPLCVVLHSANQTAYDYLGFECLGRNKQTSEDPATAMTNSPADFCALYLNSTNAEWWGWKQAQKNAAKNIRGPAPAELRVLDTIEWVVDRYGIDRHRIYLCGVSMGGCGTLGIGLPNGHIFASILADVPAGTEYAAYRTGEFSTAPSERGIDPPVVVDFSSQTDNWSKTQPALVQAAEAHRYPLVLSWGPFGHPTFSPRIAKYPICQIALAYPWLEIRKNEAYPAFTHSSCDERSPWRIGASESDESGQTNAYFRWKNVADTSDRFAMQLWIAHPAVKDAPTKMPQTATADVTLRRLQQFKVRPDQRYAWQLSRDNRSIASGTIQPDKANLLTIPVSLSTEDTELSLKIAGQ